MIGMKRYLLHSVQGRIISVLVIFITVMFLVSLYTINSATPTVMMEEKANKLLGIAKFQDTELGDRSYDDILAAAGALNASREEKITILNEALRDSTDKIASIYPDLGVGYYSLDLEAILTYGPSQENGSSVGRAIASDHPGRTVMAQNMPLVRNGSMVRGNIMNGMYPISRGGQVIGYAWANELTTNIEQGYRETVGSLLLFLTLFFFVAMFIAVYLSIRLVRDLDKVIVGTKAMRHDLSQRIDVQGGEMGEVAESINRMAESIENTTKEHEALLMAKAENHAQREFLARMSHELRTPMNGVLGMTRLAMKADTKEKSQEYLGKIQSSATLLLGIINDILDFSKIEANKVELEKTPFSIHQTVENLCELIRPRLDEKNLTLNTVLDETVPDMVIGDGLKLSQVLLNLLGNAVKFTSSGSVALEIAASALTPDTVRLNCMVKDTGIGISKEKIEQLFKPFSQADSSTARTFGGTGLGLFISKALIELMGGEIAVTSKPGEGSVFSFYVLLSQYNGQDIEETEALTDEALDHRYVDCQALLAEDNDINREIAIVVLGDFGFQIDTAHNGVEAVEAFQKKRYDLIFMDIRMPIMDGFEATRRIRAIEAEKGETRIPIIAMTANAMKEDREASKEAGMDAHIAKPLNLAEIQQALKSVLPQDKPTQPA